MMLTYEKIRELKQLEKQDKLQKLPENFSTIVAEYLNLKKGSDEEISAKNLIKSLYDLRRKKIINLAGLFYKTDKIPDNIEGIEKELYLNMVEVMRKYNNSFERLFNKQSETGRTESEKNTNSEEKETKSENTNSEEKETKSENNEQEHHNVKTEDKIDSLHVKKTTTNKSFENKLQEDKLKVVFLLDIPEIITPTGEICSFKKEEEKELDSEFATQLKEQGFCRFK